MNIKSLLLGSAAALVAVSGARAADAVVAPEPEAVEYVRVCDTYGAGFYYIPGKEICLRIGGYYQYDAGFGDRPFGQIGDTGDATWNKRSRFHLTVDARTETEFGTLRGLVDYNIDFATRNSTASAAVIDPGTGQVLIPASTRNLFASDGAGLERAWIDLAGFRIGMDDSNFTTWTGYSSNITRFDGLIPYGPFGTNFVSYTFDAGNGFSIMGALEQGNDDDEGFGGGRLIDDYVPHLVAGAKFATGMFAASVVAGWDSNEEEVSVKGRLDVTPNDMFTFFVMGAWSDIDNGNNAGDNPLGNYYAQWGGDWAAWAGFTVNASERVAINTEFGVNELDDYSLAADVGFAVTPDLKVTVGGFYTNNFDVDNDAIGGNIRTRFSC